MPQPINVYERDFEVKVRLLDDPRGTLLIPTPDQMRLKWRELRDATSRRYVQEPEEDKLAALAQVDFAEQQERELFEQVEAQRGAEIQSFTFVFRQATVGEQRQAETKANAGPKYEPLTHGEFLAQQTLVRTDFPKFGGVTNLRSDIGLQIIREVVSHVAGEEDPRGFLLKPAASSAAD